MLATEGFLSVLVESAMKRVKEGYYREGDASREVRSLKSALSKRGRVPVIAEVKLRSPSEGGIGTGKDVRALAVAYESAGAAAVSVLTEPEHFDGALGHLEVVSGAVEIPVLMKDIVVDRRQVAAARSWGADAVLLISAAFRGREEELAGLVDSAHGEGLEVVQEVHDRSEYDEAMDGDADVVGINNRDLRTLKVSIETSAVILSAGKRRKPVICESGISDRGQVDLLRTLGADGFLVGSALVKSSDPEAVLRGLVRE